MGKRDEQAIDAILSAPEFAEWRARVSAAFFDPEVREALLSQVRDELQPRLAGLADTARTAAEQDLIAALLAEASCLAPVPDRAGEPPLVRLSGAARDRKIVNDFPQP